MSATTRRSLLFTGMAGILAASAGPAIVRVSSLMAIKTLPELFIDEERLRIGPHRLMLRYAISGTVIGHFMTKEHEDRFNIPNGFTRIYGSLIEAVRE